MAAGEGAVPGRHGVAPDPKGPEGGRGERPLEAFLGVVGGGAAVADERGAGRPDQRRERGRKSNRFNGAMVLPRGYLDLAVAILAEVVATSALKASEGFTRPLPSLLVVLGYGTSFYFLSLALKTIPVAVAYAVWSGVGILLITLAAMVLYRQVPDLEAAIGMALIVAGVAVLMGLSRMGRLVH